MSTVAGVDFGTLNVRVSIVDSRRGRLGSGTADYPLHRRKEDPDYATQSHSDHMDALVTAMSRLHCGLGLRREGRQSHRQGDGGQKFDREFHGKQSFLMVRLNHLAKSNMYVHTVCCNCEKIIQGIRYARWLGYNS